MCSSAGRLSRAAMGVRPPGVRSFVARSTRCSRTAWAGATVGRSAGLVGCDKAVVEIA